MTRHDTSPALETDQEAAAVASLANHRAQFIAARDSRNRRVQGLVIRNGRYYAQLWAERGDGRKVARRFPLLDNDGQPITGLAQAREALEIKRNERRVGALPTPGHRPLFSAYVETYFGKARVQQKRAGTLENERQSTARWVAHLGGLRLDRITTPVLAAFVDKRLAGGVRRRTANLDLICLRNVLNAATEDGLLGQLPRFPKLKDETAKKRALLTPDEFERLLVACLANDESGEPVTKNGPQFRDYIRFLAYSGAREQEALRVSWSDVDLFRGRVAIGADGLAKNHDSRTVDFNPQLGALLREMHARRAPDCAWLFPSPQRGCRDEHACTFRESLLRVRTAAKLNHVGFHDLRHMFASICVMAGIDFMTIAAWMGHKDGGILVGKVYGHLLDEHRRSMANRLHFGAVPVALGAA